MALQNAAGHVHFVLAARKACTGVFTPFNRYELVSAATRGVDPLGCLLYRNVQWLRGGLVCGLIDSCITQLKDQGLSRTCDESKEEEEEVVCAAMRRGGVTALSHFISSHHESAAPGNSHVNFIGGGW